MAKRVYFAFHYQDVIDFRANVVRNHWVCKPDREAAGYFDASIWEEARKKGDLSLKRLINGAVDGTTATCVLVGSQTYARRWVRYEIIKSINRGNHVFAVHINAIKGKDQLTKPAGPDPFNYLALSYSQDGVSVDILERSGGQWVDYEDHDSYRPENIASASRRGKAFTLSQLNYRTYSWTADDGYDNFADWVGE
jgi:hypothetical protein